MLISALCDYYSILSKKGEILPNGYSNVNIHYLIGLTPNGEIGEIIDYQIKEEITDKKSKVNRKFFPRTLQMPKRTEKPGIDSNIAEHRPLYIFGLNVTKDGLSNEDKTDKAKKSHNAFVEKQLEFLQDLDSEVINAYRKFVSNWNPNDEKENPYLLALGKDLSSSGFAFCLSGKPYILLHNDKIFQQEYSKYFLNKFQDDINIQKGICGILGQNLPIARVHGKIKGVFGGLSSGTVLIGFNSSAEESYGRAQSFNSNISKRAMEQYAEVLNYLLKDKKHKSMLDDITILHWAMSENDIYNSIIQTSIFDDYGEGGNNAFVSFEDEEKDNGKLTDLETSKFLKDLIEDAQNGTVHSKQICSTKNIDPDVIFYMVGLKPNVSRLAVKFIYRKEFGELLQNIAQHQADLQMTEKISSVPLWRIKKELISPKSKNETVNPALAAKLLESIVYGYNYPDFLFNTVIRRIKTDSDDDRSKFIKINSVRVGIVKACLNRRNRLSGKMEEFNMALDKSNTNPAYLCGRLFAVLEKLQLDASSGNLNRTIKDAYFASACSNPAIIFPRLMRLSQNHLGKAENGSYWNYMLGEISSKLVGEFPATLPLVEQGKFILGYYHQFFAKAEKKPENIEGGNENE